MTEATIARAIRWLMGDPTRKWTIADLARESGVPYTTLTEQIKKEKFSAAVLIQVASAFHKSPADLFAYAQKMQREGLLLWP